MITILKNHISYLLLSFILICGAITTSVHAKAIFIIVPNVTTDSIRADALSVITYTATNGTNKTLTGISIDFDFQTTANLKQISLQNDSCSQSSLAPLASCSFQVLINAADQPQTFQVTPRVCAYNKAVCSKPSGNNTLSVNITPVTHPPMLYANLITPTNTMLQPLSLDGALGTIIGGFIWDLSVPTGMAISQNGNYIYIASGDQNTLYILYNNGVNISKISSIGVGTTPAGVALSPNESTVYVANNYSNTVSVIDVTTPSNPKTITTIPLFPNLTACLGIAVSPGGSTVYVINNNSIGLINAVTNTVFATISLPTTTAFDIIFNKSGSTAYVSGGGSNQVYSVNTLCADTTYSSNCISALPTMGGTTEGLALSKDETTLYVAMYTLNTVIAFNLATGTTQSVPVGFSPRGLSLSPDGRALFVSQNSSTFVSKITTANFTNIPTQLNVNGEQSMFGKFVG